MTYRPMYNLTFLNVFKFILRIDLFIYSVCVVFLQIKLLVHSVGLLMFTLTVLIEYGSIDLLMTYLEQCPVHIKAVIRCLETTPR